MIDVRLFVSPDLIDEMPEHCLIAMLGEVALSEARRVKAERDDA